MARIEDTAGLPEYEQQVEVITAFDQIEAVLQRLVLQRLFVTVRLPGSKESFNSTVLEVDRARELFLLDELYPENGHERLQQLREMRLHARVDGAEVDLSSTLRDLGEEGGLAFYRVRFPEKLHYLQRRRFHRVEADRLSPIPVLLHPGEGAEVVSGMLHDISEGGISFWLSPSTQGVLRPMQQVPLCEVRFPDGEILAGELEVRNVRFDERRRQYIAGGRIAITDPRDRRRVARMVAAMERQLLRQRREP